MKQGSVIIMILLFLVGGLAVLQAGADDEKEKKQWLYQWKDDRGNVYIVDELGKVPNQYRSKAQRVESPTSDNGEGAEMERGRYAPSTPSPEVNEEAEKARWQQKLRTWEDKLTRAEERQKQLEEERFLLYRRWGSPALAPIGNRERIAAIEKELQEVQNKIDEAKKMIDVVIPEEARRAGVPPGWLRE